jgi:hypothetical protein
MKHLQMRITTFSAENLKQRDHLEGSRYEKDIKIDIKRNRM